jgi:hypothetical protein
MEQNNNAPYKGTASGIENGDKRHQSTYSWISNNFLENTSNNLEISYFCGGVVVQCYHPYSRYL